MAVTVKNNIASFTHKLQQATPQGLALGARYAMREHTKSLSVPNTGVSVTRKRDTVAGKKGSSYTIYPNPASPGEYPHLRTGAGRSNVYAEDGSTGGKPWSRFGERTNGIHLVYLEMRGWLGLFRTFIDHRIKIGQIVVGDIAKRINS
jgi:hypothetical protein